MGHKIDLSAEEKKQMTKNAAVGGFSVVNLSSVEGQPWGYYTDPRTEKEMYLPCDPFNQTTYLNKGYRLGHPPNCEHRTTEEQPIANAPTGGALPANVQEIVNAAVAAALKAVGMEVPAQPEPPIEPKQLEFQF